MSEHRGEPRRVLLLAPFPPETEGRHGGSRTIAQLIIALSKRNRVALAYIRASDEPSVAPDIADACEFVIEGTRHGTLTSAVRPLVGAWTLIPQLLKGRPLWVASRWRADFAKRIHDAVAQWKPHVVQAEFSAMVPYLATLPRSVLRVVTEHEPGSIPAATRRSESNGIRRMIWSLDERRWRSFERSMLQHVDVAVAFNRSDQAALTTYRQNKPVELIPLATPIPKDAANPEGQFPPQVLFAGNFMHAPNVDAALYLIEQLFPVIRNAVPKVSLVISGDNVPPEILRHSGDRVVVTGWVSDLRPILDAAAVVVAPVRSGGGSRVKVATALAAGKATVGTSLAFAGLPVVSGRDALVADSLEGLTDGIIRLLNDPEKRRAVAQSARRFAVEHLGVDRTAAAYEVVYDRERSFRP